MENTTDPVSCFLVVDQLRCEATVWNSPPALIQNGHAATWAATQQPKHRTGDRHSPLDGNTLGDTQCIFEFESEITNSAINLCVTEQKLDSTAVGQVRFHLVKSIFSCRALA